MAIEKRHSVRSYQPYQLKATEKKNIKGISKALECIHQDNLLNWELEETQQPSGRLFAEHDIPPEDYLLEYGFQGEQIILSLIEIGFDTLWKAAGIPSHIPAYLIFGKGKERKTFSEKVMGWFVNGGDRKDMSHFLQADTSTLTDSQLKIIHSCIRSPSAINKQPWTFQFHDKKTLDIQIKGKSKYNYLDMGICLYHAYRAFSIEYDTPELTKKGDFHWIVKA